MMIIKKSKSFDYKLLTFLLKDHETNLLTFNLSLTVTLIKAFDDVRTAWNNFKTNFTFCKRYYKSDEDY